MAGFVNENETYTLNPDFIRYLPSGGQSFIATATWRNISGVASEVLLSNGRFVIVGTSSVEDRCAIAATDKNPAIAPSFSNSDFPLNLGAPVLGAIADDTNAVQMPGNMSWEVSTTLRRFGGLTYQNVLDNAFPSRSSTDGNFWFGLTRIATRDIQQWDYCVNIYAGTGTRNIRSFPHTPNSVLIIEQDPFVQLPPRPVFWRQGVWKNADQVIRIQCINKVIRYFIDDLLIYTSRVPFDFNDPVYMAILMDCQGQAITPPVLVTGTNVLVGNPVALGPSTGADCAGLFPSPGGVPLPINVTAIQGAVAQMPALPQGPTDPIPVRFQEVAVNWGEFEQRFGTGQGDVNTLQRTPIRRFEIEWDGLTPEQAGALDAHYERSHVGLSFIMTYRGEVLTNCRYMSYSRTDHTRYWVQSRQATIVRYP